MQMLVNECGDLHSCTRTGTPERNRTKTPHVHTVGFHEAMHLAHSNQCSLSLRAIDYPSAATLALNAPVCCDV